MKLYQIQNSLPTKVWKFQDFSITQILREINLGGSRSSKTAVLAILRALKSINWVNFGLQKNAKIHKKTFRASRKPEIDFT